MVKFHNYRKRPKLRSNRQTSMQTKMTYVFHCIPLKPSKKIETFEYELAEKKNIKKFSHELAPSFFEPLSEKKCKAKLYMSYP